MIEDALEFPRNSDDWLTTVIIGAVLSLLSFLVIPGLIIQGYLLSVARDSAEGRDGAPSFDDWVTLLVDGLKAFLVAFVYGIVPAIVLTLFVSVLAGGAALSAAGGSTGIAAGFSLLTVLVVLVMLPIFLLVAYLTVVAQVRLAVTGSLGAAFEVGTVARIGFNADFFVAVLVAIVVGIALSIVGGLLTVILVGFLVLFYAQIVMYYLFGRGYADATAETTGV
ncbi:DUF4013 domain-containing protein [Halapricum hydrolyticum]|uniref:DUF4013 domain-containing protein n=1 Tax=Halapricum hydrolyticum TaxID=2979991 RepID=A0AAE3IC10_9EURY|nr:DUF4013 domain-containing protein [Halapricum hydrolyticum]MCU4718326.1 DUF4013 domain-containing protein [Halapricum hydrolyticum]MCU4727226.1 DUF4013 domain-containing protein [Halapricum hydrolyticum]